ncbi:colicin E3/pyocin S6 family cytotoxin, partial [Rickettsia felis]
MERKGREAEFYRWDEYHKDIEMYDRHGKPLDALDPVTGKFKGKDVT